MTKNPGKVSIVALSVCLLVGLSPSSLAASAPAAEGEVGAAGVLSGEGSAGQKDGLGLPPGTGSTAPQSPDAQRSEAPTADPYATKILWSPPESGEVEARFLPARVLKTTPLEDLPIDATDRENLHRVLGGWKAFREKVYEQRGALVERCSHAYELPSDGSMPEASSLEDQVFRENRISFLGRVVATVVGWSVKLQRVRTMVYVEVEEVYSDARRGVVPGDRLAFEHATGGQIELASGTLCTTPPRSGFDIKPGDELLVSADYLDHFDDYLAPAVIGRVKNGVVRLSHNPMLTDTRPRDLDVLRQGLEAEAARAQR